MGHGGRIRSTLLYRRVCSGERTRSTFRRRCRCSERIYLARCLGSGAQHPADTGAVGRQLLGDCMGLGGFRFDELQRDGPHARLCTRSRDRFVSRPLLGGECGRPKHYRPSLFPLRCRFAPSGGTWSKLVHFAKSPSYACMEYGTVRRSGRELQR